MGPYAIRNLAAASAIDSESLEEKERKNFKSLKRLLKKQCCAEAPPYFSRHFVYCKHGMSLTGDGFIPDREQSSTIE